MSISVRLKTQPYVPQLPGLEPSTVTITKAVFAQKGRGSGNVDNYEVCFHQRDFMKFYNLSRSDAVKLRNALTYLLGV